MQEFLLTKFDEPQDIGKKKKRLVCTSLFFLTIVIP
jgi:hypothetical protein